MHFEFDQNKSKSNKEKHGIDFDEAREPWDDAKVIEAKTGYIGEPRFVVIGKIKEKCWTAIITYRNDVIRIISVRRSRKKEVVFYEKN